mgnify:CR=1 FL=1
MLNSLFRYIWKRSAETKGYWLTRYVFLRLMGLMYLFAYLTLVFQGIPLLGENGLLPATNYLNAVGSNFNSKTDAFIAMPTVFWFSFSDTMFTVLAWIGAILSVLVLVGYANSIILFILWFLYLSFDHIGQTWYSFGWEMQLLETGFLAIFIAPLLDMRPFPKTPPPIPLIWLLRWLTFRLNMGTGLIKLRGDPCWEDLTCLLYHYETQPMPNPLSAYWHFMPQWFHKLGILWSHFTFLVAPWFIFGPRKIRHIAGILLVLIQVMLFVNGNYSFLNLLAIIATIGVFDDTLLKKILPKFITKKAEIASEKAKLSGSQLVISWILMILVAFLSVPVILNLIGPNQYMNTSYNQIHFVNTYGAFGSVGKIRTELIIQGTDELFINENTVWKEYEFKGKPGNVYRKLPQVAPYHMRLDWLIWFAAFSNYEQHPWMVNLVWKFLHNDEDTLSLIDYNPFPNKPPNYIRVEHYLYNFAPLDDPTGAVWKRKRIGSWLPPLSKNNQNLRDFIQSNNWGRYE